MTNGMATNQDDSTTANFLSWLTEIGVYQNSKMSLVMMEDGSGRRVVASAHFDADEVIFSIPRHAVLSLRTALHDQSASIIQAVQDMPPWLALTTLMISESSRENSRWTPYLAMLPQKLDSLVFWSETELAELQSSTVRSKIGNSEAKALFKKHIIPLNLPNCTMQLCHDFASIIMAYAFDIPERIPPMSNHDSDDADGDELVSDDDDDLVTAILSMVPLADMLNADAHRNNARLSYDGEHLEMRAIKSIAQAEEIFNDYGQLPSSDLLRRYGYVSSNYAPYDVAEISADFIIAAFRAGSHVGDIEQLTSEDLEKRVQISEREGVLDDSYDLVHPTRNNSSISDDLLAFIYLLLVDDEYLDLISASKVPLPSRSNLATRLVGQALATLILQREKEYATSLEDDEQILDVPHISKRARMAVQVRVGEKRVLKAALREASSYEGSNKLMRSPKDIAADQPAEGQKRTNRETSQPSKKRRHL